MRNGVELVERGDEQWDSARAGWNLVMDQQPAAVARPQDADEVAAAVGYARERGLRVAGQAEGHGAGPLAGVGDDTLLIKTGRMAGAKIDASGRRARVGAGAKWQDVSALASPAGLAGLSGSSAEVGVVGYTLGGGHGWLARKHGLACNSVVAVELVTADGQLVRADRENEPDLFWALRGGGGSFGVVTALEFELYPVPELYAGMQVWPWERTADVLSTWSDWVFDLPNEMGTWARILQVPPLPIVPEPVRGRQLVVVEAAYLGPEEAGRELLRPLRDLGPEMDTFAAVPPAALGHLHMDPEDPVPFAMSGQLLDDLPPAAIDGIVEAAGPGSGTSLLSLELRMLGGALSEAPPDAGAIARIDQTFLTLGVGMIMDPTMAPAVNADLQRVEDALEPWDSGVKYGNFVDVPIDTRTCYPPETFERLQEVKARYDREDLFRGNHAIPCPAAAG
ncbi:MAG TPA: FAD-binding oxidoreductase [Solirubrobacteraceae bacterium]|nr:FAD-binding oxidoreductase [Solirubrobacteraceae bacterium]